MARPKQLFLRRLRAWAELPSGDRAGAIRLFPRFLIVEAGLRILSLPRLASLLGIELEARARGDQDSVYLPEPKGKDEIDEALRLAGLFYRGRSSGGACVGQSLIVGWRLRSLRPILKIGVRSGSSGFLAHAWIEIGGHAVGERGDFIPLTSAQQKRASLS